MARKIGTRLLLFLQHLCLTADRRALFDVEVLGFSYVSLQVPSDSRSPADGQRAHVPLQVAVNLAAVIESPTEAGNIAADGAGNVYIVRADDHILVYVTRDRQTAGPGIDGTLDPP